MKVGKHGPALVYNIMWAIIAGLMMGPFMIPWFLGGGIIAELSMCGKVPTMTLSACLFRG